jgi:hypothetical protein
MYELPPDFDPDIFKGAQLTSVLYAEHLIGLTFSNDAKISVWSSVKIKTCSTGPEHVERPVTKGEYHYRQLASAAGRVVERASVLGSDLQLILEGSFTITLVGDLPNYECYLISIGETEIIV